MVNVKSVNLDASLAVKEEAAGVVHQVIYISIKGSVLDALKIVANVPFQKVLQFALIVCMVIF